jgi:hypothetical protein
MGADDVSQHVLPAHELRIQQHIRANTEKCGERIILRECGEYFLGPSCARPMPVAHTQSPKRDMKMALPARSNKVSR